MWNLVGMGEEMLGAGCQPHLGIRSGLYRPTPLRPRHHPPIPPSSVAGRGLISGDVPDDALLWEFFGKILKILLTEILTKMISTQISCGQRPNLGGRPRWCSSLPWWGWKNYFRGKYSNPNGMGSPRFLTLHSDWLKWFPTMGVNPNQIIYQTIIIGHDLI